MFPLKDLSMIPEYVSEEDTLSGSILDSSRSSSQKELVQLVQEVV